MTLRAWIFGTRSLALLTVSLCARAHSPCLAPTLLQAVGHTPTFRTAQTTYLGEPAYKIELEGGQGSLVFSTPKDGKTLRIHLVTVNPDYQNQGYSTLLFQEALKRAGPRIEHVGGELALDNYAAFESAYNKTPRALRRSDPKSALAVGVQATPFYKSAARLGFTEVREADPKTPRSISVSIARAEPQVSLLRPEEFVEQPVLFQGVLRQRLELTGNRGSVTYHLSPDGKQLTVDLVHTPDHLRKRGYSTAVIQEMLRRAGDQVREIHGDLLWVNHAAYKKAWEAVPANIRKIDPELAARQAIRGTPFYRSFSRFGFTEVITAEAYDSPFQVGTETVHDQGVTTVLGRPRKSRSAEAETRATPTSSR